MLPDSVALVTAAVLLTVVAFAVAMIVREVYLLIRGWLA